MISGKYVNIRQLDFQLRLHNRVDSFIAVAKTLLHTAAIKMVLSLHSLSP